MNTGSKGFLGGTPEQVNPLSGGGANNNANALGSLGRELSKMGDQGLGIMHELQAATNATTIAEEQNKLQVRASEFQNELIKNPNPETWLDKYDTSSQGWKREMFNTKKLNPLVKAELEKSWSNFHGKTRNKLMTQAASLMVEKARASYGLRAERAMDNVNEIEFNEVIDDGLNAGLYSNEEAEQMRYRGEKEITSRKIDVLRDDDPFHLKERLESGDFSLNKTDRQKELKKVESAIKSKRVDIGQGIADGIISGEISTLEQIEEQGEKLRPTAVQTYKNMLTQRNDVEAQSILKSPEKQNEIAGEVSSLISGYEPNGENFDNDYATISAKIQQLAPSPLRKEYENQLKSIREGKEKEITSNLQLDLKQVDEMADAGLFGQIEKPREVKSTAFDLLNDGMLDNTEKLQLLGFSEKDAKQIAKEDNISEQAKLFKSKWNNEVNTMTGDESIDEMASHLASGGSLTKIMSQHEDPSSIISSAESANRLNQKLGKLKNEYSQWFNRNKDATKEERRKKLEQIGVDISAGDTDMDTSWRKPTASTVPDTLKKGKGSYKVSNKTRDQITGFTSKPGARMISLDFNDAKNKSARGIEIKVPSNATSEEIEASRAWARETQAFFKSHGVNVPIRRDGGIKRGGSGISGVFHTEPFFASNAAARKAIENDPKTYAAILGRTLGNIAGANFIPPHEQGGRGGASVDGINERDFALKAIIPYL